LGLLEASPAVVELQLDVLEPVSGSTILLEVVAGFLRSAEEVEMALADLILVAVDRETLGCDSRIVSSIGSGPRSAAGCSSMRDVKEVGITDCLGGGQRKGAGTPPAARRASARLHEQLVAQAIVSRRVR
jgi:hypothetical protein